MPIDDTMLDTSVEQNMTHRLGRVASACLRYPINVIRYGIDDLRHLREGAHLLRHNRECQRLVASYLPIHFTVYPVVSSIVTNAAAEKFMTMGVSQLDKDLVAPVVGLLAGFVAQSVVHGCLMKYVIPRYRTDGIKKDYPELVKRTIFVAPVSFAINTGAGFLLMTTGISAFAAGFLCPFAAVALSSVVLAYAYNRLQMDKCLLPQPIIK